MIEARLEATASHDWETWEALHTPDCVRTAPELETPLVGAPAMRFAIETLSAAFPDYRLELFRRWTGTTPTEARQALRAQNARV